MVSVLALEESVAESRAALAGLERSLSQVCRIAESVRQLEAIRDQNLEASDVSVIRPEALSEQFGDMLEIEVTAGNEGLAEVGKSLKNIWKRIYSFFMKIVDKISEYFGLKEEADVAKAKTIAKENTRKANDVIKTLPKEDQDDAESKTRSMDAAIKKATDPQDAIPLIREARELLAMYIGLGTEEQIEAYNEMEIARSRSTENLYLFGGSKTDSDITLLVEEITDMVNSIEKYTTSLRTLVANIFAAKDYDSWVRAGHKFFAWINSSNVSIDNAKWKVLNSKGSNITFVKNIVPITHGDLKSYTTFKFEVTKKLRKPIAIPALRQTDYNEFVEATANQIHHLRGILSLTTQLFESAVEEIASHGPTGSNGLMSFEESLREAIRQAEEKEDAAEANLKGLLFFFRRMHDTCRIHSRMYKDMNDYINSLHIAVENFPFTV